MKNKIAIVTDWGSHIGFGHAQRMLSFLAYMNRSGRADVYFICKNPPDFFPEEFKACIMNDPSGADLIVRDMRDSSLSDISALRSYAPVIVVDDNGTGRNHADSRIDLLPNLSIGHENPDYIADAFLFGYNFTQSVKELAGQKFDKNIDCAIYAGARPSVERIYYMKSLLPEKTSAPVLDGGDRIFLISDGVQVSMGFAELLLRTKVLVTYFGITMYEGALAGCSLLAVNPGEYHSRLCDIAPEKFDMFNAGIEHDADADRALEFVTQRLGRPAVSVSADSAAEKIESGLFAFAEFAEKEFLIYKGNSIN